MSLTFPESGPLLCLKARGYCGIKLKASIICLVQQVFRWMAIKGQFFLKHLSFEFQHGEPGLALLLCCPFSGKG